MKKNLFLNSRDQSLYWYQSHHVYTFEIGYTVCLILHQMYTLYNNKVYSISYRYSHAKKFKFIIIHIFSKMIPESVSCIESWSSPVFFDCMGSIYTLALRALTEVCIVFFSSLNKQAPPSGVEV